MTAKTIELQGNSRTIFLAIAEDRFARCAVTGPARAAAVGALKKRGLIGKENDVYKLTWDGADLYKSLRPNQAKGSKPRAERPRHNAKVQGYVSTIRSELGLSHLTDDAIAEKVWRFGTVEKAVEAARAQFAA